MKPLFYILLFFPMLLIGQSSGHTNAQEEKVSSTNELKKKALPANSIATNFSQKAIVAYANQSSQIITDFYSYLSLYNQTESKDGLRSELDKSILQLFVNPNILVEDFINGTNKKITLLQLLQYCKDNNFVVTVSNIQNTAVHNNHFDIKYQLLITNNSQTKTYNFIQKVYLFPVLKTFGNTQKTVWDLKLGEF